MSVVPRMIRSSTHDVSSMIVSMYCCIVLYCTYTVTVLLYYYCTHYCTALCTVVPGLVY